MSPIIRGRHDRLRRAARLAQAAVAVVLVASAAPLFAHKTPALVGADASYVVLSGSMSGTFETGDVIFVEAVRPGSIAVGDIITFRIPGSASLVTHRVVAIDETPDGRVFTTQGDANDAPDAAPVAASDVVGTYSFRVPGYGYVIAKLASTLGFVFILVVGGAIIVHEAWALAAALERRAKAARPRQIRVTIRAPPGDEPGAVPA